jgi:gentisate 1,2-dioxygenase
MRKPYPILLLALACALPAAGSDKQTGTTTLKDFQPAGTTDKKHKHQQYDFTFVASGTQYTCRTKEKEKLKATDFPVGSDISYEVDKNKGKVKNQSGREESCTVVRVDQQPAPAQ